jgi:hygromycin-B 4-O-kinase
VLDWANAMFGDPLYDAATVLFWAPWLDCMRIQAAHFQAAHFQEALPADAQTGARLLCYQLHIALGAIAAHATQEPGHITAWLINRAQTLLSQVRP